MSRRFTRAQRAAARQALADQRARLRAAQRAQRAAVKAQRAALRDTPEARKRRRRRRLLWLLLLLLLLLLRRCDCECDGPAGPGGPAPVPPSAAAPPVDAGPDATPDAAPPRRRRRPPPTGRLAPTDRPGLTVPTAPPADWLAALRLQVAARGPLLARCFEGSAQPGGVRWQARLDVARGVASDHRFEPVLAGALLTPALRGCLTRTLSQPPYRLPAPADADAPPREVSLLIEF